MATSECLDGHVSRPVASVGHGGPCPRAKPCKGVCPLHQPHSSYMDIVYKNKLCLLLKLRGPLLKLRCPLLWKILATGLHVRVSSSPRQSVFIATPECLHRHVIIIPPLPGFWRSHFFVFLLAGPAFIYCCRLLIIRC